MKIIIIILDLLILCALVLVAIGEPSSRFKINRRYPVVWTSRVSGGSIESEFSHHLVQTIDDIFNKEYCHCTSQKCKCCRHLAPPMFVPKSGLGCAQFKYLGDQTMVVTVKFDDQVIMHKKLSSECGQQTKQNAILIAYFTPPPSPIRPQVHSNVYAISPQLTPVLRKSIQLPKTRSTVQGLFCTRSQGS